MEYLENVIFFVTFFKKWNFHVFLDTLHLN